MTGRSPYRSKPMAVRILKGAARNLYEPGSDAQHLALRQLWDVLDHLGFRLATKTARETTLRAYPTKFRQYPLLNPRFEADAGDLDAKFDTECLNVTTLSKGDNEALDRYRTWHRGEGSVGAARRLREAKS